MIAAVVGVVSRLVQRLDAFTHVIRGRQHSAILQHATYIRKVASEHNVL